MNALQLLSRLLFAGVPLDEAIAITNAQYPL